MTVPISYELAPETAGVMSLLGIWSDGSGFYLATGEESGKAITVMISQQIFDHLAELISSAGQLIEFAYEPEQVIRPTI